jgi:phosphate transport system substrate-binding protein
MSMVVSAEHAGRLRRLAARVLVVLALGAPVAAMAAASPAAAFPQEQAQGSSFAALAIEQWVGQASSLYGFNINFQVSSSVLGLNAFAQGQDDFVASDIPYSSGQASSSPSQPYQYLPDVAGALAFMYNLKGVDGQQIKNLILNAPALDDIFTGKITFWDDPAIKSANPQLAGDLPHTTIVPVYREDASGENYLLSDYLLHQDGTAFQAYQQATSAATVGQPSASWPVPSTLPLAGYPNNSSLQGQNGSDGVANYVSALSSEGSIGYLETAYAISHNFPVASLVNASGKPVQPTSVNDATALESAILFADLTQNLTNVYDSKLPNAYPVSAYSYFVTPCSPSLAAAQQPTFACAGPQTASPMTSDRGGELGQFVNYLACAGQEKMALLGYSPLPPNLVQEDFNAIGRMNGGKQPPAPTAANCHNPYVDGEVPLPGEPVINTSVGDANTAGAAAVSQQAAAANAAAAKAKTQAAGKGTGPGGTASSTGGPGVTGSGAGSGNGSGKGNGLSSRHATRTRPMASKYLRFDALKSSAAAVAPPPLIASILLWCLLLALAMVVPPLAVVGIRRHRRPAHGRRDPETGPPDPAPWPPPGGVGPRFLASSPPPVSPYAAGPSSLSSVPPPIPPPVAPGAGR